MDNQYTLITASAQRTLFYEMFPRHVYGAETTDSGRDIGAFLGVMVLTKPTGQSSSSDLYLYKTCS